MRRRLVASLIVISLSWTARRAAAQASLAGTVIADGTDRPIANAEISVAGVDKSVRSDSAGAFRLQNIPIGMHRVIVRHAGYQPWTGSLTFHNGQTVEADFILEASATPLDTVHVEATLRDVRLRDFEERRIMGFGKFVTADVFERNEGRRMADILLGEIGGLRVVGNSDRKFIGTARSARTCLVQVFVNDVPRYRGGDDTFDINQLDASTVIGVEFYSLAATPARFMGTAMTSDRPRQTMTRSGMSANAQPTPDVRADGGPQCGTLVIWTK